ncbi:MAG: type II secretion system protein [Gallionella sp.]|jgi:type II secretory pathway pseudopilin PulG
MLSSHRQAGFTYLAALFLVAALGALLASIGVMSSTAQQRYKEQELLLVGEQFRLAIGRYYESSPGSVKKYPATLNDLLKDERQLSTQRYLRKVYTDPITRSDKWGILNAPEGGIMGVYSLSEDKPIKRNQFNDANQGFMGKTKYADWQFVYRPETAPK